MRSTTKLVGVLFALASSAAFADILVVSASDSGIAGGTPVFGDGLTYTADLPQFDPALGTLTGVELTVSAIHGGTFTLTSTGPGSGYIIFYVDYSFEVNGFGGTGGNLLFQDWVTEPTAGSPFGSAPGHFNTPFTPVADGDTAVETFGTQLDFADSYAAGDSEFSQFIGTGTLPFDMLDWAVFSLATVGGNNSWALDSEASIFVEATYTFIPIPSPSALSVLAVAGLLTARRRRTA